MAMKKCVGAIGLLCIITLHTFAQRGVQDMPSRKITSFPFRLITGGVILLKAQLGGYSDSLQFILDTGSGGISLDSQTTLRLNIPTQMSDKTIRGIAGLRKVSFSYHQQLLLPGLTVDSLDFHINDYDILTSAYGEKIDGIIGYAFLSRYIVKINYDSLKIEIYAKGAIKYPKGGFILKPPVVNIPIVAATVRDNRSVNSRFYFDTGAGMCLLMSEDFVKDSNVIHPKKKWVVTQAEGLGGKAPMRQGVVKTFKLGPYRFRKVPAYIFEDVYNVTYYPQLGGLIGNDLLRRFNVILNYEKKELHLIPNSHFMEAFDYSYTGLGMYWVDGEIRIEDVMPASPAEAAGLQVGDVVVGINNDFSRNIQTYKTMLQVPGKRFKILVMRSGELEMKILKVGRVK